MTSDNFKFLVFIKHFLSRTFSYTLNFLTIKEFHILFYLQKLLLAVKNFDLTDAEKKILNGFSQHLFPDVYCRPHH